MDLSANEGTVTPERAFLIAATTRMLAALAAESRPLLHCRRNSALGNGAGAGVILLTCSHSGVEAVVNQRAGVDSDEG